MYLYWRRLDSFQPLFFLERGDLFMMFFLCTGLVVVAVVLLTNAVIVFTGTKQFEKEHEKRMEEIKEKEQV